MLALELVRKLAQPLNNVNSLELKLATPLLDCIEAALPLGADPDTPAIVIDNLLCRIPALGEICVLTIELGCITADNTPVLVLKSRFTSPVMVLFFHLLTVWSYTRILFVDGLTTVVSTNLLIELYASTLLSTYNLFAAS